MKRFALAAAILGVVSVSSTGVHTLATAEPAQSPSSGVGYPHAAVYDDRTIDLSRSWEGATACIELGDRTECFDTELALQAAHPIAASADRYTDSAGAELLSMSACPVALRLYSATGYGGNTLSLTTRNQFINLSLFGFNNTTSSYRVGACNSAFFTGSNGGGSVYPGNTSAWAQASSMLSGWNNTISSVRMG